jgi:hypothetical protein
MTTTHPCASRPSRATGLGVILIAADVVPLASGVRGASKAIRVGS